VSGYALDDMGLIPISIREFSLCHHVQTVFKALPASYPVSTRDSILRWSSWSM